MPNPKGINQYSEGGGGAKSGAKSKSKKGGPTVTNVSTGKQISRVDAAAKMYGTGSKQHLAAKKRWG